MRQQLLDLNEIQKIDLGIREIEKRFESTPERLRELEATLGTSRSELQRFTEQRDLIVKEVKTLEAQVQAESIKLRKWESRLNDIRNQREYLALSREVEGSRRANREADEKITELNTQRAQLDSQIDGVHNRLAETEIDADAERERVQRELAEASSSIAREKARRDALLSKVPGSLLRKYDNIRAKRFGLGLVPVIDGSCQGCNMKLPPQLYNILQRVETVEQCPSCQRLIFWSRILEVDEQPAKDRAGAAL